MLFILLVSIAVWIKWIYKQFIIMLLFSFPYFHIFFLNIYFQKILNRTHEKNYIKYTQKFISFATFYVLLKHSTNIAHYISISKIRKRIIYTIMSYIMYKRALFFWYTIRLLFSSGNQPSLTFCFILNI